MHFLNLFFQASTVSPLVTIVIPYPGSYSGPWLNSEHLAAALAAAVFYLAFSSRYLPCQMHHSNFYVVIEYQKIELCVERLHNVTCAHKCIAALSKYLSDSWLAKSHH